MKNQNETKKARLLILLNEKKISPEDYKLLLAAMDKKSSRISALLSLLVNPSKDSRRLCADFRIGYYCVHELFGQHWTILFCGYSWRFKCFGC